MYDSTVM